MKEHWFIQVVKWLSGFISDQNGKFSRKAVALYVALFLLYMIVRANVTDHAFKTDFNLLVAIGVIILFCIGAISSETIKKLPIFNKKEDKE